MLNQFGFRRQMYYLCTSEEERACKHGFSPLFSAKIGQKMGCFTKHVGKSTCLRKISTCFSGFFSGQVGARIDDIDTSKVKRYLFSIPAFFSFQVTTLVAHCGLGMLFCAPPAGRTDGIIPPIISIQPIHFFGQQRSE